MRNEHKVTFALVGSLAVASLALFWWGRYNEGSAERARADAERARGAVVALESEVRIKDANISSLHQVNYDLAEKVAKLTAHRPVAPAPAPATPSTDSEVTDGLLRMGLLTGLRITDVSSSTLAPSDARKAYSWAQEAARVPAFEVKSAADDLLVGEQAKLISGLGSELTLHTDLRVTLDKQIAALGSESKALRQDRDALIKVQVAEKWKTRIKLGVAIPLALYLGMNLK